MIWPMHLLVNSTGRDGLARTSGFSGRDAIGGSCFLCRAVRHFRFFVLVSTRKVTLQRSLKGNRGVDESSASIVLDYTNRIKQRTRDYRFPEKRGHHDLLNVEWTKTRPFLEQC
jgi:hypothetical protein